MKKLFVFIAQRQKYFSSDTPLQNRVLYIIIPIALKIEFSIYNLSFKFIKKHSVVFA